MGNLYRMPAEWEEHKQCWMAWPNDPIAWRGRHEDGKKAITELANLISKYEPVKLLVPVEFHNEAEALIDNGVEVINMDINDAWTRDTAPSFVVNTDGELSGVDWNFNGWGNMPFSNYDQDRYVATKICSQLNIKILKPEIFNEGGAIHVDGEGTLICTRSTILNSNRNPGLNENQIEKIFYDYLGIRKVLWLDEGYTGDETGGHVDIIASFIEPGKIMHIHTEDESDPNYRVFNNNIRVLSGIKDAKGRSLEIIKIPQPGIKMDGERRLSLSYLNFYITNGAIIVPVFGDENDNIAIEIFRTQFPERDIVPFNASAIFHGGGGIHCVTQQEPKVLGRKK